jgi:hypothetical protein
MIDLIPNKRPAVMSTRGPARLRGLPVIVVAAVVAASLAFVSAGHATTPTFTHVCRDNPTQIRPNLTINVKLCVWRAHFGRPDGAGDLVRATASAIPSGQVSPPVSLFRVRLRLEHYYPGRPDDLVLGPKVCRLKNVVNEFRPGATDIHYCATGAAKWSPVKDLTADGVLIYNAGDGRKRVDLYGSPPI